MLTYKEFVQYTFLENDLANGKIAGDYIIFFVHAAEFKYDFFPICL